MRGEANEWSRGDASEIDGKTNRSIWAGAHESISIERIVEPSFVIKGVWAERF